METASFVVKRPAGLSNSFLTGAESTEVFSSAGNDVVVKFKDNSAESLARSSNVEENLWAGHLKQQKSNAKTCSIQKSTKTRRKKKFIDKTQKTRKIETKIFENAF